MGIAHKLAQQGTCIRRSVGCVLVDIHGEMSGTGWNGAPPKMEHCIDTPCAGANYKSGEGLDKCEALHAEVNALRQCKNQHELKTVYITCSPCVPCTKQLASTSLERIVFSEYYPNWEQSRDYWIKSGIARNIDRQWIYFGDYDETDGNSRG